MVIAYEGYEDQFYIDGYLNTNLETAKTIVSKDWDMLFVVDGPEGSGKSVLSQQIGKKLYRNFNIDCITFTPTEFKNAILKANKFQCIIYDEAYAGLSSKGAMSIINRTIVKMLTEIRQKNLFIIIVLPTFFDLDKYVAIWRSRALIHVYTGDSFERGFFAFYNVDKKKELYLNGKKLYSYGDPGPNFRGKFTNHYTVDPIEYKARKLKAATEDQTEDSFRIVLKKKTRELYQTVAGKLLENDLGLTKDQVAYVLDITKMTLYNYLHKYNVDEDFEVSEASEGPSTL
jgi:hypothetical protein